MATNCSATDSTRIRLPMKLNSKIPNWVRRYPAPLVHCCFPCVVLDAGFWALLFPVAFLTSPPSHLLAGRLVWRRFASDSTPSHHAVRATCVQILPLIDMYCKYVLQEDNTNLWGLMVRYDCEADLASHNLGRSMLAMIHDDYDEAPQIVPPRVHRPTSVSPFDAIRSTLAAMDVALQTMRPQVHPHLCVTCLRSPPDHPCCNCAPRSVCGRAGVFPSFGNGKFCSPMCSVSLASVSIIALALLPFHIKIRIVLCFLVCRSNLCGRHRSLLRQLMHDGSLHQCPGHQSFATTSTQHLNLPSRTTHVDAAVRLPNLPASIFFLQCCFVTVCRCTWSFVFREHNLLPFSLSICVFEGHAVFCALCTIDLRSFFWLLVRVVSFSWRSVCAA